MLLKYNSEQGVGIGQNLITERGSDLSGKLLLGKVGKGLWKGRVTLLEKKEETRNGDVDTETVSPVCNGHEEEGELGFDWHVCLWLTLAYSLETHQCSKVDSVFQLILFHSQL